MNKETRDTRNDTHCRKVNVADGTYLNRLLD